MRLACIAMIALLAGCATANQGGPETLLAAPVDCSTAESDLAALEAAMPSRRERARSAVQSVTPVGALSGAVTGTYTERLEVLSGATEEQLSARIDDIKSQCGIADEAKPITQKEVTE
ncbi:hypothetical protein [Aquisalinus flavus]|uniref:Uncharacterized protein n=1 Tax=Aquisalinus flavus TaxID=1526572 RepID=A0A8J2Y5B9_9PROT|nr:hypothetical protein [Aquisalinus flavus]MBD0426025.1 hypothetical protein [Aquisalinus flavus]UNE48383.1 hypothetical protein FF099_10155 [Aquisalinus flavus]GGD11314.1 hypothetical protein GCM10011342_20150 [Aquisalinus flavus]